MTSQSDVTKLHLHMKEEVIDDIDSTKLEDEDEAELPLDCNDNDSIPQVDPLNNEGDNFILSKEIKNKKGIKIKFPYCLKCKAFVSNRARHLQSNHQIKFTHEDGLQKKLACPYCRAVFKEKVRSGKIVDSRYGENALRRHIQIYHCEHFFPTQKQNFVSVPEFRKICAELLFEGLVDGKSKCTFCNRTFANPTGRTMKNKAHMKLHFVDEHFTKLEKRLKEIQSDPNLQQTLFQCNPHGEICECGVYVSDGRLKTHCKFHCVLSSSGNPDIYIHPRRRPPKLPKCVRLDPEDKTKVKCKLCGISFPRHMTNQHVKEFCKNQRENFNSTCKFLEANVPIPKPVKIKRKKFPLSETDDPKKVKCALCGAVLTKDWARRHVRSTCINRQVNDSKQKPMETEETVTAPESVLNSAEYEYVGDVSINMDEEEEDEDEKPIFEMTEEELTLEDLLS